MMKYPLDKETRTAYSSENVYANPNIVSLPETCENLAVIVSQDMKDIYKALLQ